MKLKPVLWIGLVVFIFIVNLLVRYIHTGVITNNRILGSQGYTIAFSLVYFISFLLKKK
ncbi:hypothetical protein SAMN04488168_15312 [Bacillus sp. 491mf]|uniref:hypothetical protein n=1 Tax=Bacillus TaxID=1386 RepID=UPI0008E6EFF9|nr:MULTISPECIES: hypothetical protein [unclassified Bacillus (in: firmicutes)]SFD57794.1 hypothetical protein SAMN04488168_15312 [Bacillus sp. 491mf]